jgi:outer membrane protein TolC
MNHMVFQTEKAIGLCLCLYLGFSPAVIRAQGGRNYSLKDYSDSAQRHLPVLLEKKAQVNAARAGVTDARHRYLPTTYLADQVTIGTDNSMAGSYLSLGIIPSSSSGVKSANVYQSAAGNIGILSGEYELVNFGLKQATIRNAEAYENLSVADLEREGYLLKWQVGKLYFDILKSRLQLAVDSQNIYRYATMDAIVLALTRSGIRAGADSALALAELSKTRTSYNQTLGQLRQQEQELSYLSGIGMDRIGVDTSQAANYQSTLALLGQGVRLDTANNPLIAYYARQELLHISQEDLVRKSYLPKILLTGTTWARGSSIDYIGNYNSLASGWGYQRFNYLGGLTFVYDLFNGVHRRDRLTISHNETLASDFAWKQQTLSLANIGNQADEAIHTSEVNLAEVPVQVSAAESAFSQKSAQYRAGIINLVDLTDASFVLYRAQSDYIQALSDWLLANLDRAAASGYLDSFIQSIKN